ncbi:MAG: hypothetical protein HY557_05150 [Euryarchaeota archaeon]|nr:hypothetical protein [Euryarchaeota archaeon]
MALDPFLIGFAFAAGAASFFSPCSVGLFPAYVGYFVASGPKGSSQGHGNPVGGFARVETMWPRVAEGLKLGGLAASGFFLLFLGIGFLVSQLGVHLLGAYLKWISIGIGVAIIALGLLLLTGTVPTFHLRLRGPTSRSPASIFTFGIGYGLASLGCTLPVFLSTLLASLAVGGAEGAFFVLLAYAAGMGLVMVGVSVALSLSEGAARTYVRRIVPHIQRASAVLVVVAGFVVVYFYAVVWR